MRCTTNGLRQKIASLVGIGQFFAHHVSRQSRPFFAFDGRENAFVPPTLFTAGGGKNSLVPMVHIVPIVMVRIIPIVVVPVITIAIVIPIMMYIASGQS